jgi:hypothetical protein
MGCGTSGGRPPGWCPGLAGIAASSRLVCRIRRYLVAQWCLDVLGLAAAPVRRRDHLAGDGVGDVCPVVAAQDVQGEVGGRGVPGRGQYLAVVHVGDGGVQVLMRLDGAKMFLLAAMAVALSAVALTSHALPRWLAPLGFLLAASLAVSGLGYVLLVQGLASAVYVSGTLLLAFVTSTGVTLGVAPRTPAARAR